jgi:hypothetical protein
VEPTVLTPVVPIPELDIRLTDRVYWDPATSAYPLLVRPILNTGRVLEATEDGRLVREFTPRPLAEQRAAVNHSSACRLRRRWRPCRRRELPPYLVLVE